ncbi:MAG: RagB/SusD family nutrient uptake outer membrane protein [Ginsengibacter sp.]
MKKIFKYPLLIAFLLIVFNSCRKTYLDTVPTDQVSSASAFTTTTNAFAALNGIHRSLYVQYYRGDQGGQGANMLYMEAMGDDWVMNAQANGWWINEYKWLSHRSATSLVPFFNYVFYYAIIGNANLIIQNIDGASGPDIDKKAIKAEALTFRAFSYFQMIRLFGKRFDKNMPNDGPGLPLVLEAKTTATPRSTVAEAYNQINKDLDAAIALFPGYKRINKSHFDLSVAKGIKARVALTQQNYTVAAQMANEARQGYSLMSNTDYFKGFNDFNNAEWMWGSHQQDDANTFFFSFFAHASANFSSTQIRGNPKSIYTVLYNKISATDIRKGLWDPTGTNTSFPVPINSAGQDVGTRKPYQQRKFLTANGITPTGSSNSIGDVPYMRASEMYLIEAEARARAGGQDAAAAAVLFALVKQRDPGYVLSVNTGQALIDEIMIQRRIELWGEGFRWYDLKRTNSPLDRTGGNHQIGLTGGLFSVPAGDKTWEWLIPQSEIDNSGGLVVQNPL